MREIKTALYMTGGIICIILGFVGIFLPVLPTTPFILLAAFLFTRSSNRALQWLLNNRWFGSRIRNYREGRGMAARDKAVSLLSLWVTIGLTTVLVVDNLWVQLILVGIASGVTFHLLRIKTYRPREKVVEIE